jgi:hypothetical protein
MIPEEVIIEEAPCEVILAKKNQKIKPLVVYNT